MTNPALPVHSQLASERRWLRIARAAASCSLALFLIPVVVIALLNASEGGLWVLVPALFSTLFWLPYLWMLLQMRGKDSKTRKKGLALALAYGAWALILGAVFAWLLRDGRYKDSLQFLPFCRLLSLSPR